MPIRPRSRILAPQALRVGLGVAVFFFALLAYGPVASFRASVARAMARIVAPHESIRARAFLFHVPFRRQERALSCEVASLRTALSGIGIEIGEWDLWLRLPKDLTPKRTVNGNTVWGNPANGFVGSVDGRMPSTGYGVFIDPLASVANLYASTSRMNVADTYAIDAALSVRHPVIVWTEIGPLPPKILRWTAPDGTPVTAPAYEHTVVLVGYRGTADNIEGVYVVDPLTSLRYEPWSEFLARTAPFGHVGLEIGERP